MNMNIPIDEEKIRNLSDEQVKRNPHAWELISREWKYVLALGREKARKGRPSSFCPLIKDRCNRDCINYIDHYLDVDIIDRNARYIKPSCGHFNKWIDLKDKKVLSPGDKVMFSGLPATVIEDDGSDRILLGLGRSDVRVFRKDVMP